MKIIPLIILGLAVGACSHRHPAPITPPAPPIAVVPPVKAPPEPVPAPEAPKPVPPVPVVPALPDYLRAPVDPLPILVDGTLKGIMRDGAHTDSMYNSLAARYRSLVKVYECVRKAVNTQDVAMISNCK